MESSYAHRGYTVVELMVVLAILTVIMSIAFTSQSTFNKTLVLANTAYDVALTLRDAAMYGGGSRVTLGGVKNAGYGVHFEKSTPEVFTLFSDTSPMAGNGPTNCHPVAGPLTPDSRPGDCAYQPASERVLDYTLGNRIKVSDLCAREGGSWACGVASIDIVFSRPNAEPFMSKNGTYSTVLPVSDACIMLTSPQGGSRFVKVSSSGVIAVNETPCI